MNLTKMPMFAPKYQSIPNKAIASTNLVWCDGVGVAHPFSPDCAAVERLMRSAMAAESHELSASERELIRKLLNQPPMTFSHIATELGPRINHHHHSQNHSQLYTSSSEESVVVTSENPNTPLPFATRPLSYNNYSSSSSSEIAELEALSPASSEEEDELTKKMKSSLAAAPPLAVLPLGGARPMSSRSSLDL